MKPFFISLFLLVSCLGFSQTQTGKASFYADKFDGRPTASGEIYKHNLSTAAHRKLPFGSQVKVTNLQNNKSAIVKINDRGPFIRGRIIDLSRSVAESLDIVESGVTNVRIEVLGEDYSDPKEIEEEIIPESKRKPEPKPQNSSTQKPASDNFDNSSKKAVEDREFYELTVDEVQPDFYGLQIASFTESDNLLRLTNQLKVSYKSKVLVQIKTVNGNKVYTIILGQFNSRNAAENFKSKLEDKYPDSFIVDMTRKD